MSANEKQERRADKKNGLIERLHNPAELRLFLTAVVLGIGYTAIYMPFDKTIVATTRKLADSRNLLSLADEIGQLQKQYQQAEGRLTKQTDSSEWMEYLLSGIRRSPLRLDSFSPSPPRALGPFQIVTFQIKLSGSFADLDGFLHWLESNERLFRVDNVKMAPAPGDGGDEVGMDITVLGVMG